MTTCLLAAVGLALAGLTNGTIAEGMRHAPGSLGPRQLPVFTSRAIAHIAGYERCHE